MKKTRIRDKHPGFATTPASQTTVPSIKEVEKDSETAARTKVENMMTEAMIRTCPKCGNRSVGFSYSEYHTVRADKNDIELFQRLVPKIE
jgi:hypothetical protein